MPLYAEKDQLALLHKMMVVPTDQPKVFRVQNPDRVDTNNVYMAFLYIGELHKKERIALSVL